MDPTLKDKRIVLVIGGGIAAYKSLDLIRRLRERGASVEPVMTAAAGQFVTPLSVGALSGGAVHTDLFDPKSEHDVGHIRLARGCDMVIVAPATADLMARMANGLADDLASAILLATRAPMLLAPAMNPAMWDHPATRRNRTILHRDGVHTVGPETGEMAESGEAGAGRMSEANAIADAAVTLLTPTPAPLAGRTAIVTSGPTHEPIDPVRYIANRSSGRQGHAIAAALAKLGATVHLVSGPVAIADPPDVVVHRVERAEDMCAAVIGLLPADIAVMVAAVADWRPAENSARKLKKAPGQDAPHLALDENPDILMTVAHHPKRPAFVAGFAAETDDLIENATAKLQRKGADMIVANDVSAGDIEGGVMGGARNRVHVITRAGVDAWPEMTKEAVAGRLAGEIARRFETVVT